MGTRCQLGLKSSKALTEADRSIIRQLLHRLLDGSLNSSLISLGTCKGPSKGLRFIAAAKPKAKDPRHQESGRRRTLQSLRGAGLGMVHWSLFIRKQVPGETNTRDKGNGSTLTGENQRLCGYVETTAHIWKNIYEEIKFVLSSIF